MKASFEYVDYHAVILAKAITNGDHYAKALKSFLEANGWDEDKYIKEMMVKNEKDQNI